MTQDPSEDIPLNIRMAQQADAAGIARIYVESWRETYANILPDKALTQLSERNQALSWAALIAQNSSRNPILVAVDAGNQVYGFSSAGQTRDRTLPFEAEVYTLYVAPGHTGQGIGQTLLAKSFKLIRQAGYRSTIIWALANNPSRFFYEAQGGVLVAERFIRIFGGQQREIGYGWRNMTPAYGNLP